jgi:hypothetical protein
MRSWILGGFVLGFWLLWVLVRLHVSLIMEVIDGWDMDCLVGGALEGI